MRLGQCSSCMLLSFALVGLLTLGLQVPGLATEPHICINNTPSTHPTHSIGGVGSYTFYFKANCGSHTSNTISMKITVQKNVYPYPKLTCTGHTSTTEYPVPPDSYSVTCTGLPTSIRAVIDYHVSGSGPMSHTSIFSNP
jgi:hypothetical protein